MTVMAKIDWHARAKKLLRKVNEQCNETRMVSHCSAGRVKRIGDMHAHEVSALVCYLGQLDDKLDRLRKRLLSLGYQAGFNTPKTPAQEYMSEKDVNLANVKSWLLSDKSRHRKALDKLNTNELIDTITQLQLIAKKCHDKKK